jgi:hypothetical protein
MAPVEYHYILTLTGKLGSAEAQTTAGVQGLVQLDPETTTRAEFCAEFVQHIQSAVLARTGSLLNDPNIICFSLERNQL